MKFLKYICLFFFGCVALIFCAILFVGAMNYSGFCWSEKRYFSDEEKIKSVLTYLNNRGTVFHNFEPYKNVPYASADEILDKNPDCCSTEVWVKWGDPKDERADSTFVSRVLGGYSKHVNVKFVHHLIDANGKEHAILKSWQQTVSNCADAN